MRHPTLNIVVDHDFLEVSLVVLAVSRGFDWNGFTVELEQVNLSGELLERVFD